MNWLDKDLIMRWVGHTERAETEHFLVDTRIPKTGYS